MSRVFYVFFIWTGTLLKIEVAKFKKVPVSLKTLKTVAIDDLKL